MAAGLAAGVLGLTLATAAPASAHGFSSTMFADVTSGDDGTLRAELGLEYDLLVVSAAEFEKDDEFFQQGLDLFETGEEKKALDDHADTVISYATDRFTISDGSGACEAEQVGDFRIEEREGVPYAFFDLEYACDGGDDASHEIRSSLFADDEGYVKDAKTIVTYDLDGHSGSAALDAANPTFSTAQPWYERLGEFFLLGAEHLLTGIDHILFLLALIVGSRRLRDIVLAATTFTIAHSITFLLAALGVVSLPASIVEPIIAISIAIVAGWYLWGVYRRRGKPESVALDPNGLFGLNRADWMRLAVVFAFGLIHGVGFAGALGIDEPFSWLLLWSLLVFNVGIEVVQLTIIAVVFPILVLLRRRAPRVALWVGVVVGALVTVIALVWFVQRILGVG
jgi:hydrogenase/urease accessory protein HupE